MILGVPEARGEQPDLLPAALGFRVDAHEQGRAGAPHAAALVFKEESFASRTIGCLLDEPRGRRNFCRRVSDVVQEHDGFPQTAEDEAARVPSDVGVRIRKSGGIIGGQVDGNGLADTQGAVELDLRHMQNSADHGCNDYLSF